MKILIKLGHVQQVYLRRIRKKPLDYLVLKDGIKHSPSFLKVNIRLQ